MTDSRLPDDVTPISDDAERADAAERADDRSGGSAQPAGDKPGAPGNDEPMTDSTDGGLEGGDPGVEE
jgi:hypothetical protein